MYPSVASSSKDLAWPRQSSQTVTRVVSIRYAGKQPLRTTVIAASF